MVQHLGLCLFVSIGVVILDFILSTRRTSAIPVVRKTKRSSWENLEGGSDINLPVQVHVYVLLLTLIRNFPPKYLVFSSNATM